jgi:hypothetical protein
LRNSSCTGSTATHRALLALGTRLIVSSKSMEVEDGVQMVRQPNTAAVRLEATFDASREMQIPGEHDPEAPRSGSFSPAG